MTISCMQSVGGSATGLGTAVAQVVGQPPPPSIQVPSTLTSGRAYVASVPARPGATYLWSVDNGGAIVSAGGASGVTSADGSTNSIRFTTGAIGALHVNVTETDVVGHLSQATVTIKVVGAALAPAISAPVHVTSTRAYSASVPARGGFTYRWEAFNGSVPAGAEAGVTSFGLNSVTFNAGSAQPDNSPGTMTLTCTETNATGDSSASATFTATIFPSPLAPVITVVKQGLTAPITSVSDGPAFVYVASVPARAKMRYQWIAPPGASGVPGGTSGQTFTFSFGAGTGSPGGVAALLQATELNFIDDFAVGSTQLTVFTAPSSTLVISTTAAIDSGTHQFLTTSGRSYTASIVSRGGAMTYQWSGDSVTIAPPGLGPSASFTAGSANPDNTPNTAALRVRETNGAGDSAESSRAGLVFPAPQAPTYRVARSPSGPPVTDQKITQTVEYMATLTTHAQMTYAWQITAGTFTGGGTSSAGTFIQSGTRNQVKFRADDAFPSTIPTTVTLQVSELNAIGDFATSAQPDLTAFPFPVTPSFAAGNTDVTAGDTVAVTLTAPRTNLFYDWTITNGTFSDGTTTAVGSSVTFIAGAANPDGSRRNLVLSVAEVNGTGDASAPFSLTYHVFPKPVAPTVVLTSGSSTLADGAPLTQGDAIHASVSDQPGITFNWAASHSNPASGSGSTFDFTGVNNDAAGNPVVAQITATASNAIGVHADSPVRTLQVHPLPATPDVVLATGAGVTVASGADVTAGSFQATTTAQKSALTYKWSIAPAANRANVTGDTTTNVHFDALANADGSNATVTVSIAVSNVLGSSKTATATLVVHPATQTPSIHVVGPDGNDSFVTQGAAGVKAQVAARAHFHYAWTYAFAGPGGISSGTLTNPGGAAGDFGGSFNFVVFAVPADATQIRLSCTELSDLEVASAPAELQVPTLAPPSIQSFLAQPAMISAGTQTQLTATFTGGTGSVDHGVGPVTSGVSKLATLISETTTFTLTVTSAATSTVTATALVTVTNPTGWVDLNNATGDPIDTRAAMPYSLTFDPADATNRYAATLTHGILHTPDGSPPWTEPAANFPTDRLAFAVTVGRPPPDSKLSLWASVDCTGQLYHSLDSGAWTAVTGGGLPAASCGTGPTDLKLDPSDATQQTLYVAFSNAGLFRSQNDGASWAQIPLLDATTNDDAPTKLAIAQDGTVFVGTANGRAFRIAGGAAVSLGTSTAAVSAIAVDPAGSVLIVGREDGSVVSANAPGFAFTTGQVFATAVNGLTFAPDGIGTTIGQPAITGSVYAVVGNGVYRSIDLGATFANVTASTPAIDNSNYFSVIVHPDFATTIFVQGGTGTAGSSGFFGRTF